MEGTLYQLHISHVDRAEHLINIASYAHSCSSPDLLGVTLSVRFTRLHRFLALPQRQGDDVIGAFLFEDEQTTKAKNGSVDSRQVLSKCRRQIIEALRSLGVEGHYPSDHYLKNSLMACAARTSDMWVPRMSSVDAESEKLLAGE